MQFALVPRMLHDGLDPSYRVGLDRDGAICTAEVMDLEVFCDA